MDFQAGWPSPLVGPVARGTAEPSVGCVIDFSSSIRKGRAGLGLGVIADQSANLESMKAPEAAAKPEAPAASSRPGALMLLVNAEQELVIDGRALGMPREITSPLPSALTSAMMADKHRIGLTAAIKAKEVLITLRAKAPTAKGFIEFHKSVPLLSAQRERLLAQPVSVLSIGGNHGVTPYLDDGRAADPDLNVPASADWWRNPGDRQLAALYRAVWQLGSHSPASLVNLRDAMLKAADSDPAAQQAAIAKFKEALSDVLKDLAAAGDTTTAISTVVDDLKSAAPPAP
jgi:hypothetical protein